MIRVLAQSGIVVAALAIGLLGASAHTRHVHSKDDMRPALRVADRPLTIGGRRAHGIYRVGNDIIAPGGFSAHGYGYPPATRQDRIAALNARIRDDATGLYDADVYGVAGVGPEDDRSNGYTNPFWGNRFNNSVGYNGVPTALAFGPAFANRHISGHDPDDDDEVPGPTPGDLGYSQDQ